MAFYQALRELEAEGGVPARQERYRQNHETLIQGMASLGFRPYLNPAVQSCIITAFHTPLDSHFEFNPFYRGLSQRGFIIYPGKLTQVDTFRIGNIGRIFPTDMEQLIHAVRAVLLELGCTIPLPSLEPMEHRARD